ncbi:MAG: hypothetical protein PHQ52_02050, partial [Candidatus Omnitrophica bacterium]|nr:hypothetical protein [Candidatus Omnitrophota bacterium]
MFRKKIRLIFGIIFICTLMITKAYSATYIGGSGSGDDSLDPDIVMFQGGSGSGDSSSSYTDGTEVGYGSAYKLAFIVQPESWGPAEAFFVSPIVAVEDEYGNVLDSAT